MGLTVALALVLGFACPAYADEGDAAPDNHVVADHVEAVAADALTEVPSNIFINERAAILSGNSADETAEPSAHELVVSSIDGFVCEAAAQPYGDVALLSKEDSEASQSTSESVSAVTDECASSAEADERTDGIIAPVSKGDAANVASSDEHNVVSGAKQTISFDAEQVSGGAGEVYTSSRIVNVGEPADADEYAEVGVSAKADETAGIDEPAGTAKAADTADAAEEGDRAETGVAAESELEKASNPERASKQTKAANDGAAESAVIEASCARIDAPAMPESPIAEPSAYEQAASEAQEAPEPEEQSAEIASRTLVRRAGTSNPASPVLVEASPIRVDGPLPSSQFAVLPDYVAPETSCGFSFSNNAQNRAGALLYQKARCRSP